jgi:PHD/YefM family antitoxin component YafN of YafNO toxin-antitoxin module
MLYAARLEKTIMNTISENDLEAKGVSALEAELAERSEAVITVRGKNRFVVMSIEQYNYLRECELEAALLEARADLAAGRTISESVDEHIRRVTDAV